MAVAKIVICDDRGADAQSLRGIMEGAGLHVVAMHTDGRALLDWCRQNPGGCDLILLDVIMPVLDGYAAFWELRELKPAPGVIFVSVENTPDVVKDVIGHGALDFLVKPFKREDVVARVKRALSRK